MGKTYKEAIKHKLEVYHPYAACAIVGTLLAAKTIGAPQVDKFFTVAYETTRNDQQHFSKGYDDAYLVFFLLNVITILRFLYRYSVLEPIARKLSMSKGLTAKFVEAGWFGVFYLASTTWGYFIFRDDAWWFSTRHMWDGYPHAVDYDMKLYYLFSLAFWLQSLLSFTFEPPRKDDSAMGFHHLLTVALIVTSYLAGFVRVGAAILMQQNAADIIYYHSKLFKYAKLEKLSTVGWISFVFAWFYTRHVVFGAILYSYGTETLEYIPLVWSPETDRYMNFTAYVWFFVTLWLLQGLMLFWFTMIVKVAWRVITGKGEIKDTTEYSDEELEARRLAKQQLKKKSEEPSVEQLAGEADDDEFVTLSNGMRIQRKKSA